MTENLRITVTMNDGSSYRVVDEDRDLFSNPMDHQTLMVPAFYNAQRLVLGNPQGEVVTLFGLDTDTVIGTPL